MYAWGIGDFNPITLTPTAKDAQSDGWTRYNFMGYEGRDAYGEYKALIDQMKALGADATTTAAVGRCGRTTATTVSTARRWR